MRALSCGLGTEALLAENVPRYESLAPWNARAGPQHVTSARVGQGALKEERTWRDSVGGGCDFYFGCY